MLLASKTHSNSHAREETGGTIEAISGSRATYHCMINHGTTINKTACTWQEM